MAKVKTNSIHKRFKDARVQSRLTQEEFAAVVGMSPKAISAIENGLYTPNFKVISIMKKKLGVSYDYLIDGELTNTRQLLSENKRLQAENLMLRKVVEKLTK